MEIHTLERLLMTEYNSDPLVATGRYCSRRLLIDVDVVSPSFTLQLMASEE